MNKKEKTFLVLSWLMLVSIFIMIGLFIASSTIGEKPIIIIPMYITMGLSIIISAITIILSFLIANEKNKKE